MNNFHELFSWAFNNPLHVERHWNMQQLTTFMRVLWAVQLEDDEWENFYGNEEKSLSVIEVQKMKAI